MKQILLIVDPQNDFCKGGALEVDGAYEALELLSRYLENEEIKECFDKIIVTQDYHLATHCSFKENGGIWPSHCVRETEGADIIKPLENVLTTSFVNKTIFVHKGEDETREEYSIFDSYSRQTIIDIINGVKGDDELKICICGVAGDFCVLETLKGVVEVFGKDSVCVFKDFTASIDGGEKLTEYCGQNGIDLFN